MKLVQKMMTRAGVAASSLVLAVPAFAGTTGSEFTGLYNLVKGWSEGYLGRTLAIAAFLVGAIVGFAKSTAMPALVGIIFAVLFAIIVYGVLALAFHSLVEWLDYRIRLDRWRAAHPGQVAPPRR